jgi:hypothetical protein
MAIPRGFSPEEAIGRLRREKTTVAGWSSPVAREAHNLEVAGSNPVPAISRPPGHPWPRRAFFAPAILAGRRPVVVRAIHGPGGLFFFARPPGGQSSGGVAGPSMAPAGFFFARHPGGQASGGRSGHPWPRRAVFFARPPGGQSSGGVAGPSMAPAGFFCAASSRRAVVRGNSSGPWKSRKGPNVVPVAVTAGDKIERLRQ